MIAGRLWHRQIIGGRGEEMIHWYSIFKENVIVIFRASDSYAKQVPISKSTEQSTFEGADFIFLTVVFAIGNS